MVTTRNRYKNGLGSPTPLPSPLPKTRRTRQTKSKNTAPLDDAESETVESSSPTPTPDSASPSPDTTTLSHGVFNDKLEQEHEGAHSTDDEQEHDTNMDTTLIRKSNIEKSDDSQSEEESEEEESEEDEEGDEEGEEGEDEPNLSEDKDEDEDEDEDEDDLNELLAKAQASLKRKAMFDEKEDEPRFNFPKLESGLDTKNIYIKQHGNKAKIDVNTVTVTEKGKPSTKNKQPTLETCEVNKDEKVHLSKKQRKEEKEKTAGKGWFDLPQQVLTPELKRDLQILKLRNVLDPKRFYKREEKGKPKFPKYFQVGTIVEGNTEFYSSRLTKKERATTITGEVMKDLTGRDYYKRKFNEIQEAKQSGGKRFYKKGKGKQSKSWRAGNKKK